MGLPVLPTSMAVLGSSNFAHAMPPPETDALPPPPPGLEGVDTHHDTARDIGQQVEAMILDATYLDRYRSRKVWWFFED